MNVLLSGRTLLVARPEITQLSRDEVSVPSELSIVLEYL
jgi:hypothetical protein